MTRQEANERILQRLRLREINLIKYYILAINPQKDLYEESQETLEEGLGFFVFLNSFTNLQNNNIFHTIREWYQGFRRKYIHV